MRTYIFIIQCTYDRDLVDQEILVLNKDQEPEGCLWLALQTQTFEDTGELLSLEDIQEEWDIRTLTVLEGEPEVIKQENYSI